MRSKNWCIVFSGTVTCVTALTLNMFGTPARGQVTYCVAPNGNDSNPGTCSSPWRTISHAVNAASPVKAGDIVLVQPGTYTELINLDKSGNSSSGHITLKANGAVTLRDPDPYGGGFPKGVIRATGKSYWIVDGFRIENAAWAGISLGNAHNMIVQNNHTYETGSSGIIVEPSTYYGGGDAEITNSNIKILHNTIERANWRWNSSADSNGTQEALSIWGVDGFEVAHNTLNQGKREGIDVKVGSRNGSIHDNNVTGQALVSGTPSGYNGGPAIYIDGNRASIFNLSIYNNVVHGNVADAILLADEDPQQGDVSNIRIYNNVVYGNGRQGINGGRGITVGPNVNNVQILHNTLYNNVQAIYIDGNTGGGYQPRNILVQNNIMANSSYRHQFVANADSVRLESNLFTTNLNSLYELSAAVSNFSESRSLSASSIEFVNSDGNDFHLRSSSSAINASSSSIPDYVKLDKDGISRPQSGSPDMGAYEYR